LKLENDKKFLQSSPKRIYYVWNYLEWGGAQIYLLGLMNKMKEFCEVRALMPTGSNLQILKFLDNLQVPYEFFGAPTDANPAPTLKRKLERHWNKLRCEFSLLRYLTKFDLSDSIIHTELMPWQSLTAVAWLCRRAKVFVTLQNSILPIPKHRRLLWQLKCAVAARFENFYIFASNEDAKESLRELFPDKFFKRIKVTYTNVNPTEINKALQIEISREEICGKFNLPADKFLVFCVGQFIDRKGRWIFLEAAEKVLKSDDDTAFVWISNSNLSREDERKIENYSLGENFFLINGENVGSEHIDLFKLLRVADVFTLPSYVEGLPIALLEAMALGIPSISTNVYAIPEAVKHHETGCLIEAGDSEALKDAILELKNDASLRRKLSKNGREFVLANFSEPVVADIAAAEYFASFRTN